MLLGHVVRPFDPLLRLVTNFQRARQWHLSALRKTEQNEQPPATLWSTRQTSAKSEHARRLREGREWNVEARCVRARERFEPTDIRVSDWETSECVRESDALASSSEQVSECESESERGVVE